MIKRTIRNVNVLLMVVAVLFALPSSVAAQSTTLFEKKVAEIANQEDKSLVSMALSKFLYSFIFEKEGNSIWQSMGVDMTAPPTEGPYLELYLENLAWYQAQQKETWSIDGVVGKASAYYLENEQPTSKTVILVHGYRGSSALMGPWAKMYYDLGYNVLTPDASAHGNSEGTAINFGWLEKANIEQWIKQTNVRNGEKSQIILHGLSMGAATVMMTAGDTLPSEVKAVVEDSGYTSVSEELSSILTKITPLLTPYISEKDIADAMIKLDEKLQKQQGFSSTEASALNQLTTNQLPMLFMHAANDNLIPASMMETLAATNQTTGSLSWMIPSGDHIQGILYEYPAYEAHLRSFLNEVLPTEEGSVRVQYRDEANMELADYTFIEGEIGTTYKTEPVIIAGYGVKASEGPTNGVFKTDQQTVTYRYQPDDESSTTESSTTESSTTESSTTENSKTESSTTASSTIENSTTESSTIENSTTESSTIENSTTERGTTESNLNVITALPETGESQFPWYVVVISSGVFLMIRGIKGLRKN